MGATAAVPLRMCAWSRY